MARLLLSVPVGEPAQPPAAYNAGLHTIGQACWYAYGDACALTRADGGQHLEHDEECNESRNTGLAKACQGHAVSDCFLLQCLDGRHLAVFLLYILLFAGKSH